MKILIADDEPVSRRLLQGLLTKWGYEVVSAEDGNAAWERMNAPDAPRIALLDWMMPEQNGVDVCPGFAFAKARTLHLYFVAHRKRRQGKCCRGPGIRRGRLPDQAVSPAGIEGEPSRRIRLLELEDTLVQAREAMRFKATHDALTGVWNRGTILETLERETLRSRREGNLPRRHHWGPGPF